MTLDNGTQGQRPNGPFACAAHDELPRDSVSACPCCGGTLTLEVLEALIEKTRMRLTGDSNGLRAIPRPGGMIIDPHAHMISRTTDDYEAMARAGVVAVIEPAFWLGQPRTSVGTYIDYLSLITGFERFRAGQFGIRHYCTVGLNPKEANNEALAEAVMDILPRFALKDGVVAMGELGYDEQTQLEDKYLRAQIELAKECGLPIMIHTPHRDKKRGTLRTIDVVRKAGFPEERVLIDHNNEETLPYVLETKCWAGHTIYPHTKMDEMRMATLVKKYGSDRIIVNSAADWGISDPLKVPKTIAVMREQGIADATIEKIVWDNPVAFFAQSGRLDVSGLEQRPAIDRAQKFETNSVLRGDQR
jgi:predicted metal-dependent TIM-barrel fold hydrolase